jgi:polysaccharide export outer membrane protein
MTYRKFFQPRTLRIAACAAAALAGAGCGSIGPGMHMDVIAARNSQPGGAQSSDIRSRADVYALDAATVASMQQAANGSARVARPAEFRPATDPWVYRVQPQDVLRIIVFEHPELTNPAGTANELSGRVVNSDGRFFFPYVGAVQAAGRTVQEIQNTLADGLTRMIKNPQVEVSVLQFRSQRVVVAGEVRNPGQQVLTDVPPSVAEAVAQAGGLTPEADLANITVTRGSRSARVDLYAYLYEGQTTQNFRLEPGDVINVPDRRFSKVFVLGEVNVPQSLPMPRGRITLAEALSDAGGVNPLTANSGQIYVIRDGMRDGQPRPQIYHLNASTPEALVLADRFDLRARDLVFVDAVGVVRWNRIVSNILPTLDVLRETLNDTVTTLPR